MAVDKALRLSELVCSRLCHDISGLLSALEGTLQLLDDGAGIRYDALIASVEGAKELSRRVRLLREAWAQAEPLDAARLDELASGLPGAHRMKLDMSMFPPDWSMTAPMGRMVLNVLLLASESLPRGGSVFLTPGPQTSDVIVRIDGPRARWPAGLVASLVDDTALWDALAAPQQLMPSLVALLSRDLGIRVTVLMPAGRAPRAAPPLLLSPLPAVA
ncbi:MAG: histidine phosphotransferase family protein [Acetobacteraceae bacterium]